MLGNYSQLGCLSYSSLLALALRCHLEVFNRAIEAFRAIISEILRCCGAAAVRVGSYSSIYIYTIVYRIDTCTLLRVEHSPISMVILPPNLVQRTPPRTIARVIRV